MGVLGLWRLIDATGKPVPLETLEGKVLAVDVSIWIHQVIQGYQDRRGNTVPNAHLIGLFNRICKLMYFKIKPVFVFDGGVPLLKKNTIATRRKLKSIAATKAQKLKNDLINNLIKHTAVKGALEKENDEEGESSTQPVASSSKLDDIYKLPDVLSSKLVGSDDDNYISTDDEIHTSPRKQSKWAGNIHSVDITDEDFKNLPADVRYDILTDLKETRKQNSWGRMHEMPAGSNPYSGFQVKRLLKRRHVQESLEEAEKEMGGKTLTLEELDRLLTDQGIETTQRDAKFRIASDSTTRVVYMKDMQLSQINEISSDSSKSDKSKLKGTDSTTNSKKVNEDSISIHSDNAVPEIDNMAAYDLDEDWLSDSSFTDSTINESQILPKSIIPKSVMNPALAYMLENSGLNKDQILKIVEQSKRNKKSEDTGSQSSSTKKRKFGRRSSLQGEHKKRNLLETTLMESLKSKEKVASSSRSIKSKETSSESEDFVEVIDDSSHKERSTVSEMSSDSDDFVEVPIKIGSNADKSVKKNYPDKTVTMDTSESDLDDFIEIQSVPAPEVLNSDSQKHNLFQITIKANENLEDDIFADVFAKISYDKKEESKPIVKSVLSDDRGKKFLGNTNFFPFMEVKEEKLEDIKEEIEIDDSDEDYEFTEVKISNYEQVTLGSSQESLQDVCEKVLASTEASNSKTIENVVVDEEEEIKVTEGNEDKQNVVDVKETEKQNEGENDKETEKEHDNLIQDIDFSEDFAEQEAVKEKTSESSLVLPANEEELITMKQQLENEQEQITGSLGKLERQATDITDQMRLEAQELLRLFGLPYVVAPMEAEAQCAYLEQIRLTDGTITDDSDIWLFGGHCVYKNFFDNNKKVLQFLSNDIEHHFKLSRNELIQLALLVGSDYTNGLAGVGPVTAMEIIAQFPSQGEDLLRGLRSFCSWLRAGKLTAPTKVTLRNKLKNVQIERGFPSQAVVQAYLSPTVDESREPFSWAKPNLVLLSDYVKRKFGWTKLKFDEIMNPVMLKLNESKSQNTIHSYFKIHTVPKSIEGVLSKRVQTAVQRMAGKTQDGVSTDDEGAASAVKEKPKRVRKTAGKKGKKAKNDASEADTSEALANENESKHDETDEKKEADQAVAEEGTSQAESQSHTTAVLNPRKKKVIKVDDYVDFIPQREQDKANALKAKLKAIEIFRKSKKGLDKVKKRKRVVKKVKEDAELSESSSDS